MSFACPNCHDDEHLWEVVWVSGWRALDRDLKPTYEREADWCDVEPEGEYGCSKCDKRGWRKDELAHLGIDGQPLPFIHELQQVLEVAA